MLCTPLELKEAFHVYIVTKLQLTYIHFITFILPP